MKKATVFIGAALTAASLALAGPACASPGPAAGTVQAAATAAAAPGQLGSSAPKSTMSVQDASNKNSGARIGASAAAGSYTRAAIDGTTRASAAFRPAT